MSKNTRDDVDRFFDYHIHLPTKTLFLGSAESDVDGNESGVDGKLAEIAVKALHILDNVQNDLPITIKLNSIGGDEYHGLAIYDAIQSCKTEVHIIVYGHAMSMGSIILQAADKRIMSRNARVMIHYGTPLHADDGLHAKEQHNWTEECKKFNVIMEDIYLEKIREKNPAINRKQLQKMLDFAQFFTAEEAVEEGLADEILE